MKHNIHIVSRLNDPLRADHVVSIRFDHITSDELLAFRRLQQVCEVSIRDDDAKGLTLEAATEHMTLVSTVNRLHSFIRDAATECAVTGWIEQLHLVLEAERMSRERASWTMKCRDMELNLGTRTLVMGVLNVTPDSFSDGGQYVSVDAAVRRAKQMVEEGADIIDLGGESTRPNSEKVPLNIELERVVPVVKALREAVSVPISIDTYKSEVAKQALEAGAHIINDVWGLKADPLMAKVVAEYRCPVILMHNRHNTTYTDLLGDVIGDLRESIKLAKSAGIDDEQIIIDPGIGFAKTYEQNLQLMNRLKPLTFLGYPILLGTSRKSMIRTTLNLPSEDTLEGTAATVVHGITQGCGIVRVHDVKQMKRAATMADAMINAK